jgi:hypothetical protein
MIIWATAREGRMRTHYIIDSAATLLGVALLIVTAVHITGRASATIADELAYGSALLFLGSCASSHFAIAKGVDRFEDIADKIFALGLVALFASVLAFWF